MLPSLALGGKAGGGGGGKGKLLAKLRAKHSEALNLPDITSPRQQPSGWDVAAKEVKRRFVSPRLAAEAREAAAVEGFIGTMMRNAENLDVQTEAFIALCVLVSRGPTQTRLCVSSGGLPAIILAMQLQIGVADIQQRGATALSRIATTGPDLTCRHQLVRERGVQILVEAAERHAAVPAVQERCCTALAAIADRADAECRDALIAYGAMTVVVRGMQMHIQRANLQMPACAFLAGIAEGSTSCRSEIVNAGGVAALCDVMHAHKGNITVEGSGCAAMMHLVRRPDPEDDDEEAAVCAMCVRSLVASGGLPRLVSALRYYPTNPSLTQTVAATVASVSAVADEEDRKELLEHNLVPALIGALDRHAKRPSVAERGIAALANVMASGTEYVHAVVHSGGLFFVCQAFMSNRKQAGLLLPGCLCLVNAGRADLDAKEAVLSSKALKYMIYAMHEHPEDEPLVEAACAALANIAAGTDVEHEEELAMTEESLATGEDAVGGRKSPTVGGNMKPPPTASNRPGTTASLSRSRPSTRGGATSAAIVAAEQLHQLRVSMLELGAAPAIVHALSMHKTKRPIIEEGLVALRNLAAGDSHEIRDALLDCESAQAISYSVRGHLDDLAICTQGCLAIRNLGCGDARQLSRLIHAGGVGAVVEALSRHAAVPALAQAGCAALRNIAVDTWGSVARFGNPAYSVGAITDADGPLAIVEAMTACANNAAVQSQGCGALRNIACGTQGDPKSLVLALTAIQEAAAIEAVLKALANHGENHVVSTQACAALRNVAMTPQLRGAVTAKGGVEAVISVLRFSLEQGQTGACEQATACLSNLMHNPERRPGEVSEAVHKKYVQEGHQAAAAAVAAGAVQPLATVLATWSSSGLMIGNVAAGYIALLEPAGGQKAAAKASLVEEILAIDGALDGLVHGCLDFPDMPHVFERACSCVCHMLHAAPKHNGLRDAIERIETKRDLLHAVRRAREREHLRSEHPGLDEFISLIATPVPAPAPARAAATPSVRATVPNKRHSFDIREVSALPAASASGMKPKRSSIGYFGF